MWKSDGTEGGTARVKDIWPGAEGSYLRGGLLNKGNYYFYAYGPSPVVGARLLFQSDGTPTGTLALPDQPRDARLLSPFLGDVFFAAQTGFHRTNGTTIIEVAKVEARHPGSIRRESGVLTGFSRGAYAAPVIARTHPGRWPYLVLIEANVPLAAVSLRKAGVRAVALVAGETGTEIAGERKTSAALEEATRRRPTNPFECSARRSGCRGAASTPGRSALPRLGWRATNGSPSRSRRRTPRARGATAARGSIAPSASGASASAGSGSRASCGRTVS